VWSLSETSFFSRHVLSGDGIEVKAEKVKAVRDWPVPKNMSELRSFLGMVSYYRKFIPGFANIVAPWHKLLRKSSMYEWGLEQMNAFCTLKERLISAPILGMPTDSGMFLLDSDASSVGSGAVISRMQNGKEVVIAYASRSLSNADRNHDTIKRELLAVTFGLRTFRQYLLGRKFTIRTDHSAL